MSPDPHPDPDPDPDLDLDLDLDLPDGFTCRPLVPGDAQAVVDVIAAQQLADVGEVVIELADIVGDWQRPSFDLATGTIGVFTGARLVAYAEVDAAGRGDAAVHPDFCGRGLGTALARWRLRAATTLGASVVGMPVPAGSAGERLLTSLGYRARWQSWELRLPAGVQLESQELPAGCAVRRARPAEYEQVWTVAEDAFLEWSDRERATFADFAAQWFDRPGFAAWNVRVAVDAAGAVVGMAYVSVSDAMAFVSKVAVAPAHRGRGLAKALLVDAFTAGREHGATVCALSTDSRTGALGLYEHVGMVVTSTWVNYAIAVPPAPVG